MQSNVISEQAESCSEQGNEYPFCYPTFTDVWRNGSTYDFIWNFNYPYYVQHEYLNLYLYYYIKFEYKNVKNFTRLDQSLGSVKVTVDDSWFLSPLEPGSLDLNLTLYGFYLPSTENVTEELSNPISMYPRPFNFTITQMASPSDDNHNTSKIDTTNNNSSHDSNDSNHMSSLPGWAIAVIVIAVVALICGIIALIWITLISRRDKKDNKRRRNNKLIPIIGRHEENEKSSVIEKPATASIHSRIKMSAFFRSTDSVPGMENASSVGTFTSSTIKQAFHYQQQQQQHGQPPMFSPSDERYYPGGSAPLFSPTTTTNNDSIHNRPSTSSTLAPPQDKLFIEDEFIDEELRRRRLGEALLQRQLEEDGASVKHAGRFTRVKSLADIQKSAVFEQNPEKQ